MNLHSRRDRVQTVGISWRALVLVLLLCGTALDAREMIRLEIPIFEGGEGSAFFIQAAREYEKLRPDIKVDLYGDPRIADKVRVRVLDGTFVESTNAPIDYWPLIRNGDIASLDHALDGPSWDGDTTWRDSFVPGMLEPYTENGKTYGLPLSLFTNVIWYNPDMFARHGWVPPKTWPEFFDLCERIKATGIDPLAFQGRYPYYAQPIFASAYYGLAGLDAYRAFRAVEPGAFDSPATVYAFEIVQRFARYFRRGSMGMSHTDAQIEFVNGHTAMIPCGSWLKSEMLGKIPDGFRFAAFNLPATPGGAGDPRAMNAFSNYFFIFAHSKHPAEAIDFLRFMTSRRMARQFSQQRDIPNAIRGANEGVLSSDLSDVARIIDAAPLNYGNAGENTFIRLPEMHQAWDDVLAAILEGRITPADAARSLEHAATAIRARAANPWHVTVRHAGKTWMLGVILVGGALYLGWRLIPRLGSRPPRSSATNSNARASLFTLLVFIGLPALIYGVFVVVPSVRALLWSVYQWDGLSGTGSMRWVGLLNYKRLLLESDGFWIALGNNLFLMLIVPLFVVPISMFLAACLNGGVWGAKLFRVVFFFPNLLGTVAATLLWLHLYNPQRGLVNSVLSAIGLSGFAGFDWLSSVHLYWALIPIMVWGACGFNMILYLAAMQNIPNELYEAAEIEGIGPAREFWMITLPLIWDILIVSIVFLIIAGMKTFDMIWLLTNQRPTTQTHVIGTRLVQSMFGEFRMGEATAMAVLLFVLVFMASLVSMRVMKREAIEL